jgi:murein DD-endopeptidase MepM/ murein hydrolase activator NlpD
MTFQFLTQPLQQGRYEPEGIYLALPLEGSCHVAQTWGENSEFYSAYSYQTVGLKGHNGIDFWAKAGTAVLAVDKGRVIGMGNEPDGWGRYLKVEHSWGESFYAHVGTIHVDTGQVVERQTKLATVSIAEAGIDSYVHFGILINPYNRFDGWGGFVDPMPFLDSTRLFFPNTTDLAEAQSHFSPHPMAKDQSQIRRP